MTDRLGELEIIGREDFRRHYWHYGDEDHVTAIGPSRCGKTALMLDLAEVSVTRAQPALMLVKKPRDALITRRIGELGWRRVEDWPLSWWDTHMRSQPIGHAVWPVTNFVDVHANNQHKAAVFRRGLLDSYARGNRIVITDDAYGLSKILGLHAELTEMWTESGAMKAPLWSCMQRAADVPLWAYQSPHMLLFRENDRRGRDRFNEIGGLDADLIRWHNVRLAKYQALYVHQYGPHMCIVDRQ